MAIVIEESAPFTREDYERLKAGAYARKTWLHGSWMPLIVSESIPPDQVALVPPRLPRESDEDLAKRSVLITNLEVPK
jgi:hypothetical protein